MGKNRPEVEVRCPKCMWTLVHTRIKTRDRVCRHCGYIGELEEFEVKAEPEKKKKKK